MPRIGDDVWFYPSHSDQLDELGPLAAKVTSGSKDASGNHVLDLVVFSRTTPAVNREGIPFAPGDDHKDWDRPYCRIPPKEVPNRAVGALAEYASG